MKRSTTQPLKNVIQQYLDALKMNSKLKEVSLVGNWEKFMGGTISKATKEIYIKDRVLYVYLNSSVIRNELLNIKEPLMARLNEEAGDKVIDDIVLR